MSGAEALAVISIISNIVTLVDISIEVFDRAKAFSGDVKEVPKAFQDVQSVLPLVANTLRKTQGQAESGQVDEATCKALRPVVEGCKRKVTELNTIFQNVLPADGASKWSQKWKAVSSMGQDKKGKAIAAAILVDMQTLTYYHIAEGPTAAQVASITAAISKMTTNTAPVPTEDTVAQGFFVMPYARNSQFVGRDIYIEDLGTRLEKRTSHNRVALVGLGGIGKSQIAIEYAYRHHEKLPETSIYWIHASNASRFEQDYLQIGKHANLPGVADPKQETKQLVRDWLNSKNSGTWIMIVDNADDADMFFGLGERSGSKRLFDFLPQCSNGSIIFTTRNKKAGVKFATAGGIILLPKMDPIDGEELLKARLGDNTLDQSDMIELLQLLEYLPLAISQAASFIAENSISISEYLQMYNESEASRIELLSEDFEDLARDSETRNPVAATWAISFEQIRESNILATNLLSFMACLDRQSIPKAVLPADESPVKLTAALGLLKAYSLTTASQNDMVLDMHRLVHLATRSWLRLRARFEYWAELCLTLVSQEFPSGEHGTLNVCDSYLPHALVVLGYEQLSAANDISRASLAHKVSRYFQTRGAYNSAETVAEKAVRWRVKVLGPEHSDTLASMFHLASVLGNQGRYDEAERMNRQELKLSQKVLGPEHPGTLASMNNLAWMLSSQGKYDEAETMHRQELKLSQRVLGPEHPGTLSSMNNLAWMLSSQGKYDEAEAMHRRVLKLSQRVLGPGHPGTLSSMNNLAWMLSSQGKYDEAEAMHRRGLELSQRVLGPEHPGTLSSMNNLASTLDSQGKYDEAEAMHRQVLGISKKVLGPEHPGTLASMSNLASVLDSQGKYDEAEAMHRQELKLSQRVLGPEHPGTLASMNNLASVLRNQGKYGEAEVMHQQELKLCQEVLGPEHPDTLTSMNNLALVLSSQGKYGEAEAMHRQVLDIRQRLLGPEYPSTLVSMFNLASVLDSQGNYDEAEMMHRQELKLSQKVLGPEHPGTLASMFNLASVLDSQGKYDEAEAMHRQELKLSQRVLGPEHPDTLLSMNNLATMLNSQGKYDEAERMHRHVLNTRQKVLSPEHPRVLVSMSNLASVLDSQGEYAEAEAMHQQVLDVRQKVLGPEHPSTLTSMNNLASTLDSQGKHDEAERMRQKLSEATKQGSEQ
ncbi:MAG: hypothetical protein M1839_001272 [Geoglossum umbratile]|nr:MAG: hypothetical protein M1839_001272 [Geoglossum umbratile]